MMLGPIGLDEERSVAVAVAVDRNDKHSFYALQWAAHVLLSKGQTLTLIHVHQTSLPTGNNDFSNGQDPDDPCTDVFLPYRLFCSSRQVFCDTVMLEDQDIGKALIDYVSLYRVQTLVLGTQSKAKHHGIPRILLNNRSEVASTVMKGAPGYCSVYTIAKGNKVASAREATHPLKSSLERMQNNIPERKLISSASYMCRSRTQDEVIQPRLSSASGCSQGRLSTDSSLMMGFYQNLRSESGNCSPPRASSFSSYARKNGFNFTRGLVDSSFEQNSADEDTLFSFSNDENRPNSLPSSPTTDEVMGEMMRRLELETNQTMEMYHEACKQAVKERQKTKELENLCKEMEKKLREAEREKEEALAMLEKRKELEVGSVNKEMEKRMKEAEREREEAVAMAMAATEEMKSAKSAAEREAKKRKDAERNMTAMREGEASKIIVLSSLAESHVSNKYQNLQKILIVFVVFYFYFFELKRALKYE